MNKIFSYFFITIFCVSVAFANTDASPARIIPTESERIITNRTAVSRGMPAKKSIIQIDKTQESDEEINKLNDNATVNNTDTVNSKSVKASRSATPRSDAAGNVSENSRNKLESAVRTNGRSSRTQAASINNTAAVKRAGIILRPTTAEVGGRATISGTSVQTGSNLDINNSRSVTARAAATRDDAETIAAASDRLSQVSAINTSCQEQYSDCMDQFCAVIDDNQKRCTCSANLSKYEKVETAVQNANTQLNEVAQRIRYVGLSEDEITAINSATEAEDVLDKTTDKTESRNMLEKIEDLIKDPSSVSSSATGTTSGLDLDLDFSGDNSDLFSVDFLGNTSSSSFANLRGTDLYSTAKKRCKTVLSQCEKAGADTDQIVANYDLLIDKDCINYEQGLTKMNDTLKSNVRSATRMLQKARLAVLENQNEYDAKGCISALSDCMTDDMVCGSDYAKCIDPTKRYIDENGSVVLGENISYITDFMQTYNNALIDERFLKDSESITVSAPNCKEEGNNGACIVKYLLGKIGTGEKVTDGGLCRAVLEKCQRYTYDEDKYLPYNDVVVNYIQRAMVNIQAAQRTIISDYASSCMTEIADCYNDQVSQVSSWSSSATVDSVYKVMRGACRNVSLTCSYAVFASDAESCPQESADCATSGDCDTEPQRENQCIESVSKIFYQSLLCPDDSTYTSTTHDSAEDGTYKGYVNDHCTCNSGYATWGGECTAVCDSGEYRTSSGSCYNCDAGQYSGGNMPSLVGGVTVYTQDVCHPCAIGFYCPGGSGAIACPSGTTSIAAAESADDCHSN